MQDPVLGSKGTASFQSWTRRGVESQVVPVSNDEIRHADLVFRGRPPNLQFNSSSASLNSSPFQQGFSINGISPQSTGSSWSPIAQYDRIQEVKDDDEEEIEDQVYEITPLVYLDEWQSDPFSALPTDLPQQVLAEQMHQCNSLMPSYTFMKLTDTRDPPKPKHVSWIW